jgi:Kef-type K+ transport system membrane component KefB/nucleotide-binding universal stress UspA family protein/mannitol/fructose-specific phosphotransferase system IIA component (Ntr-type)
MHFALPIGDPTGIFFVILALILFSHFLSEKLRIPALIGLVAAGVLVGPSGFGLLARGQVVDHLGELGLVYTFFLLGVDADFARMKRAKGFHIGYGVLLSTLPLALGAVLLAGLLHADPLTAVFLGLAIASQSLLPSPALQKLGLGKSRPLLAAEGATTVTELLRTAALAIAAFSVRRSGDSAADISTSFVAGFADAVPAWIAGSVMLAAAVGALALVLPGLASIFFKRAKANDTVESIFVLAMAFLSAWAARLVGLEPFALAFASGILLGRFFPERSSLERRLRFMGDWLFMPFFLVALGMSLDLRSAASDWRTLEIAGLLTLAVVVAKYAAALLLRIFPGFSSTEANLAFGLTASQATSAIAVAGAAFGIGAMDDTALAGVVLASLATCAIGILVSRSSGARLAISESRTQGAGADESGRILVGLSNPSRLDNLMDLAFALRRRGSTEPVLPVSVVPESEDNELELSSAESLLAKAIVRGNEAGVPIAPATIVSVSVAEGLRETAREKGASTIVMGWSRAAKFSRALFGSVTEQVLAGSPELVVVAHIAKPARDISRIILVMPPLVERHPGYERGLAVISTLLSRTGAHLSIYAMKPHGPAAREAASHLRARGQIQVSELDTWKDFGAAARGAGAENAAFALFCARPGGPAWHPAVEKLPRLLEEEFVGSPMLLFYLPEAGVADSPAGDEKDRPPRDIFSEALLAGRVMPDMQETAIMDGVRELLRGTFSSNRKALGRLSAQLTEIAQKAPIELEPGVVLLHAHVPEVEEPLVFFGARPAGFRILALESPARIIVVLCSPESLPPEAHLATLGEIARLFNGTDLAGRLLAAKRASELARNVIVDMKAADGDDPPESR